MVHEGTQWYFYKNGGSPVFNPSAGGITDNTSNISLGRDLTGLGDLFGTLDELSVWNRALSQAEIDQLIFSSLSGDENGLVAYYDFDEGIAGSTNSIATLYDRSKNSNNGALTGFALTGTTSNWVASGAMDPGATPTAPYDVFVDKYSNTELQIKWSHDGLNVNNFVLERATDPDFVNNVTQIASFGSSVRDYIDNVGPNATYFYRLRAKYGISNSPYSSVEYATTGPFPVYALNFEATNSQYVTIPDDVSLQLSTFTWEAWFYFDGTAQLGQIMQKRNPSSPFDQISISISDGNPSTPGVGSKLMGVLIDNTGAMRSVASSGDLLKGWHHVALTNNSSVMHVYLDGNSLGSSSTTLPGSILVSHPLNIGASNSGEYFTGVIDEVKIFNFVKTDFSDRFDYLSVDATSGLVAYYSFDEGQELTLVDRSKNTNDGSLVNNPTWTTSNAGYPEAPENLIAYVDASDDIVLSWDAVSDATEYRIERYNSSTSDFEYYATVNAPTTTYTDTNAFGEDEYQYQVRSFNGYYESAQASNVATGVLFGPGYALAGESANIDRFVLAGLVTGQSDEITMSGWIRLNGTPADVGVIFYNGTTSTSGYGLIHTATGELAILEGGVIQIPSGYKLTTNWTHVAIKRTSGVFHIYINGNEFSLNPGIAASVPNTPTGNFFVGGRDNVEIFDGEIDEVKVWNVALSDYDRISEMYDTDQSNPNLLVYYDFNQLNGATVYDRKGSNNGVIQNLVNSNGAWTSSGAWVPLLNQATAVTTTSVGLNLVEIPSASEYVLYYATEPTMESPSFLSFSANAGKGTVYGNFTAGTVYYYRVSYKEGTYESAWSDRRSFMVTPGNALSFDGVNDQVDFTSPIATTFDDFTIEFWAKVGTSNAGQINFFEQVDPAGGGSPQIIIAGTNSNAPYFFLRLANSGANAVIQSPNVINDDTWHHIAFVRQGADLFVYKDGLVDHSVSGAATGTISFPTTATAKLSGDATIDDFRIWSYAKTDFSDRTRYFAGDESGLLSYLRFDSGIGGGSNSGVTTATDYSKYQNDGVLTNFLLTGATSNWVGSTIFSLDNFVVTNTSNSGAGSLFQAITDANASSATDVVITFNISGNAPWDISVPSSLPAITKAGLIIDGTSQPNWDMNRGDIVHISNGATVTNGINVTASNVEIYGLWISGFNRGIYVNGDANDNQKIGAPYAGNVITGNSNGIYISASDNVIIQGNHIGTLPDGITASTNSTTGIYVTGTATGILIGGNSTIGEGNIISGNSGSAEGVNFQSSSSGFVYGNYIGVADDGQTALPNGTGILVQSAAVTIGGSGTGERNIISGNSGNAVALGSGSDGSIVQYNYIGLGSDGTTAVPNDSGVDIFSSASSIMVSSNVHISK